MKKVFSLLLVFLLTISSMLYATPTSAEQVFTDVSPKHSNYQDIAFLLDKGIISADKKIYGVKDIVTREEVAVMVAKAVGLDGTQRATKFKDVPKSHKNSGYIQSAVRGRYH